MTARVALSHRTHYRYDRPVALSAHEIRLCPRPRTRAIIERYALTIKPSCEHLHWHEDAYGNWIAQTHFAERLTKLDVDVGKLALDIDQ